MGPPGQAGPPIGDPRRGKRGGARRLMVGRGCQGHRLPLPVHGGGTMARAGGFVRGEGNVGGGGWPENPGTTVQCSRRPSLAATQQRRENGEREKKVRLTVLPQVELDRGGALVSGGGPWARIVGWTRRGALGRVRLGGHMSTASSERRWFCARRTAGEGNGARGRERVCVRLKRS